MRAAVLSLVSLIALLGLGHAVNARGGGGFPARSGFVPRPGFVVPHQSLPLRQSFSHRAFRRGSLRNNGVVIVPPVPYDALWGSASPPISCQELVTVPSEDGGTRQILITRC